jgi:tetratricopeptide (TPR) repeat protein
LAPDGAEAHYALACVWLWRKHLDKAAAAVQEAIGLFPFDPRYHILLGQTEFRRARWQAAREAAEKALEIDPQNVDALNLRAGCLRKQGRGPSARDQLESALRVNPDDPWTHANLGWTHLEKGDRRKAMGYFRESLRLNPELDWAREGVVETLKANNLLYRGLLKYFFWMQRFGRRGQWTVILGAWFLYFIVRRIADAVPASRPWLTPLMVAYVLFVVATWLAVPLANLALRLHPFGRLALSRQERVASNWIGGFLLGAAIALGVYLAGIGDGAAVVAIWAGAMVIPLAATFHAPAPWPRKPLVVYSIAVGAMGVAWVLSSLLPDSFGLDWSGPLADLTTSVLRLGGLGFLLGVILSPWAGNILMSIQWKQ